MRVVIDTDVAASRYLTPQGRAARALRSWQRREFELLVPKPILNEFQRVLVYERLRRIHGMGEAEIREIINDSHEFARRVEPSQQPNVVKDDPTDDMVLACAVAGDADVIASGAQHLLALEEYAGIFILSSTAFLVLLQHQAESEQ